MREILETVVPYIYWIFAFGIVAVVWLFFEQIKIMPLVLFKGKSYRRYKGRGVEVFNTQVLINPEMIGGTPKLVITFKDRKEVLMDALLFGQPTLGESLITALFRDGKLYAVMTEKSVLSEMVYRRYLKIYKCVALSTIGANILWTILSKM